jgi:hypothetical protein
MANIAEGSVIAVRAKLLLDKMREVAAEIADGRLTPGVRRAINYIGEPVCAFGHAACRAAKEAGVTLRSEDGNYPVLVELLDGDYGSALSPDEQDEVAHRTRQIERSNDRTFSEASTAGTSDREELARLIEDTADSLEHILLSRPPKPGPDKIIALDVKP